MTLHLPAGLRRRLLRAALAVMARRPADMLIGGAERPYMRRWWLFPRNRWFNIYLHDFQRDDDDRALHDHPWPSLSILLQGDLIETYAPIPARAAEPAHQRTRHLTPGAIVWRGPRFAHRLSLTRSRLCAVAPNPAITLFIVGPRVREWGLLVPEKQPGRRLDSVEAVCLAGRSRRRRPRLRVRRPMHAPSPITARDIGLALREVMPFAAFFGSIAVGLVWVGILS